MHRLKSMFLPILTAVDYCRINTIFEWYLHYSDLGEGCRKHWKKKKKIDRKKHWKGRKRKAKNTGKVR